MRKDSTQAETLHKNTAEQQDKQAFERFYVLCTTWCLEMTSLEAEDETGIMATDKDPEKQKRSEWLNCKA